MPLISERHGELGATLRGARTMTAQLMSQVIGEVCRRFPFGQSVKTARVERFIDSEAWIDAGLALIELELPLWQVRRIAYDGGEWYCALSRERELPDWLDRYIEVHHGDLALAILGAFIDAYRVSLSQVSPSVPAVSCDRSAFYEPIRCENFG
jgi:hypothetical protein